APLQNVWTDLTPAEADSVKSFLQSHPERLQAPGVKTTETIDINWLEALRPNKSAVLPYLASKSGEPDRWAKAMVPQIIDGESYLNYYAVGPLPISSKTRVEPLTWPFHNGRYGIKNPMRSFEEFMRFSTGVAANNSDVTEELLGASVSDGDPLSGEGLMIYPRVTFMHDGKAFLWMGMLRPGPRSSAWSILPQGLFFKVKVTSFNETGYEVMNWYYNGEYYNTADDLKLAMKAPGFVKAAPNLNGDWTTIEDLEENEERAAPPPVMIQPQGPRYKLDRNQQYVSYMGWTFYFTSYISTGPALYDIRFRNETIMYELGLQEALSHYAGDDPIQGGQEFLDATFGMGRLSFELVPGYDCPAYADYISTSFHMGGEQPWTNNNSICIFEYTADHLLQRHTSARQVTVSKNTYLVLRYVSTVGNYDYTISYLFYLDGTLEVKVRASGFIFAAFLSNTTSPSAPGAEADKYGYRIHDAISSSMHDHVLSFRADLDVAGLPNTFSRVAIEPHTHSYPWEQPEIPVRNTMRLHDYPVDTETGLNWPANSGEMYIVSHASAVNAWGEKRGYRITPGTGMGTPPHLTIRNSSSLGKAARWAEKDLWVLRRKDAERSSAEPMNWFSPVDPLLDFDEVADGESLLLLLHKQEWDGDLVLYFNLGAHHVPHSGDLPNTLMHTSASGVAFVPHNFFDRDPSRRTSQGVRLALKG
ncbi:amine oxidase catalytic domain-containing protein, partial [Myriangium duriaei CBS 260.36]